MAEKERIGKGQARRLSVTGLIYESAADGLTAHAGGTQAAALPLRAMINRVATVSTTGDSVALMPAAPGLSITVINAGASTLDVYPAGTDMVNALGLATPLAMAAGKVATFTCAGPGQWHSILTA